MVNRIIVLDSGVIGLVTNPNQIGENLACTQWLLHLAAHNVKIIVPEIADYEVRRELLRANKNTGLRNLERLIEYSEYLPITTDTMRLAALLWAQARQRGLSTAGDKAIDGDVILAAQARSLHSTEVVIATTNVRHLSIFVAAKPWDEIVN